jgi:glutathione S-transferase
MIRLYHFPQTTADRVRWLLAEMRVPFEPVLVDLMSGEHKRAEYLKINPNGLVPTLVDGDAVVFESSAILFYLTDKFGAGLAPAPGTAERAAYYQWTVFASTSVDPPAFQVMLHSVLLPEDRRDAAVCEDQRRRFAEAASVVERGLGERAYLVGDRFTTADVMMASALYRGQTLGLLAERPALRAYVERLVRRPAAPFGAGSQQAAE